MSYMIFDDNCYLFVEPTEELRGLDWKEDQMAEILGLSQRSGRPTY